MSIWGTLVQRVNVDRLDHDLLAENGRLKALFPADQFKLYAPNEIRVWCHTHARYGIPTLESVTFIRNIIADRTALEIGAGNGDLGWLLGIRETDSYIQQDPIFSAMWKTQSQPRTNPSSSVEKLDAITAVMTYRPQVVIASWFTRKFEPERGDIEGKAQAFVFGEREEKIFDKVETYIHIGNENVHGEKTLLKKKHEKFYSNGLVSRAEDQSKNVIYVWHNPKMVPSVGVAPTRPRT